MNPDLLVDVAVWSGSVLGSLLVAIVIVKNFMIIGKPNEVLVFSGRKQSLPDGTQVGFRVVRGGRSFRVPLLEKVDSMDMTVMPIDIKIRGAYAKGNIPINVDAVANVKLTNDEQQVHHAIERFLGRPRDQIRSVAKETLEGTLRGVLALLTPEEVNHDRQKLADNLKSEVADDLGLMGLSVDTFKIQHVTDEVQYLDSISRIKIAEVLKEAEIAESHAKREADETVAEAGMRGQVALEQAQAKVVEESNDLERYKAELEAKARSEEETTIAAGLEARALAQRDLQEVRGKLQALQLQAEAVIPADKERAARELHAAGDAAIRAETGRAQASALSALYDAWSMAGEEADRLFLIQQIDDIIGDVAKVTKGLETKHVNLIDGGDGKTLARYVGSYPAVITEIFDRIRDTVGVDVVSILTEKRTAAPTPPSVPGNRPLLPRKEVR
ncbi:MAG: flotillin family protein [Deltaproteobacteria bacterium]|nr:flotillin family protein [Deltaproteobacteria bacterium]